MIERIARAVRRLAGSGGSPPEEGGGERSGRPVQGLVLYHFTSCPFCVRVRVATSRLGIDLPMKDIRADPEARAELIEGGGSKQVPCLRIEEAEGGVRWLYESGDIVRYLEQRYA
ncbi:MAG: glutaredoxin [Acidobacteria bacterium]|nr:MAG: glutaredoxin [Acidobacteriota bacterium]REK03627.1 MAG: glutaredoxin [Acidobacteriota bacterium]